jgi:hypothetical protein
MFPRVCVLTNGEVENATLALFVPQISLQEENESAPVPGSYARILLLGSLWLTT